MGPNLRRNKELVIRFNQEVIEKRDIGVFAELMSPDFVNRTARLGMSSGSDGMLLMLERVLWPAFPDLCVEIHDQIAEDDKVTTRKTLHGTHYGELLDISPTGRRITIDVIDIVRLRDGRYAEHWSINSLAQVISQLRSEHLA